MPAHPASKHDQLDETTSNRRVASIVQLRNVYVCVWVVGGGNPDMCMGVVEPLPAWVCREGFGKGGSRRVVRCTGRQCVCMCVYVCACMCACVCACV
jgi:hypothetical protein